MKGDIYRSLRAQPLWVQIWMFVVLIPVNLLGLFFWENPIARWIGILGILGIIPNIAILLMDRAFSNKMAVSHVIPWTMLVVWIVSLLWQNAIPRDSAVWYLAWTVLAVNVFSLCFDYKESYEWWQERNR